MPNFDNRIEPDLASLSGQIEYITYANEETGYTIADLATNDDDLITIVGNFPYIHVGELVTVYGKFVRHPKYGDQFAVEQIENNVPRDEESLFRYLSSGAIKGIGKKLAERIMDKFHAEAFDVIENHPEYLADIPGISPKKAKEISECFREQSAMRETMLFFRKYFGTTLILRIYKTWGDKAVNIVKENPYRLCTDIEGVGFSQADAIALNSGFAKDDPRRISSALRYAYSTLCMNGGHTCIPKDYLVEYTANLLEADSSLVLNSLGYLTDLRELIQKKIEDTEFIFSKNNYEEERFIADKLTILDKLCPITSTSNTLALIEKEEMKTGMKYAPMQHHAIEIALSSGIMILTGGPGTGKTTVVHALLRIFESIGKKVDLCAPTGRAAKRLSEATGRDAKTIHRLLEYGGEDGKRFFHRNEKNHLEENVFIIDEASMLDNSLFASFLKAVKNGSQILLIGDTDQLPSVGCGNVLHDLIASKKFATITLTEIFRQAKESLIVTNAHAINKGEMPILNITNKDFFFMPRGSDNEILKTVVSLCQTRLPKAYGEKATNGLQVICASRKGTAGVESMNSMLQNALNPPDATKDEVMMHNTVFRVGDRVMQIRNNYDLEWNDDWQEGTGIFNGDIGVIKNINKEASQMGILFDDRFVKYDFSLADDLELAYAITVHKSQGSEYPIVILPLGNIPPMLMSRHLLYTALTRAEEIAIFVGREDVIATMVENNKESMRYTGLQQWLK